MGSFIKSLFSVFHFLGALVSGRMDDPRPLRSIRSTDGSRAPLVPADSSGVDSNVRCANSGKQSIFMHYCIAQALDEIVKSGKTGIKS